MRAHHQGASFALPTTFPQVANQLLRRFKLRAGWLIAIEIAHKTNAETDVVHVVAVDVAAVDLAPPAIPYFDLTVPRRRSISDNEMVGHAILHSTDPAVIILKRPRVPLPGPAVVHDNEFPASPLHRGSPNRVDGGAGEVTVIGRLTRERPKPPPRRR